MSHNSGVSIIICCHNGESVIAETLQHIFSQNVEDSLKWEVLLVNNASTDNTVKIAQNTWDNNTHKVSFRIVDQPVPGKSNALKKGIKNTRFEFVLICDDDNLLDKDYVQAAYDIMANNSQVGFLGGCGSPRTEGTFPQYFQKYKNLYACGEQSRNGNDITYEKAYVYGAGAVFRKSIFEGLNANDYLKVFPGRTDENLVGGEDNLMGYIAVIAGFKVWYSDQLRFTHVIKEDRLKWDYLTNIKYANGRAQIYLDPYRNYIRNETNPKGFISQIATNIKHILSILKNSGLSFIIQREGNPRNLNYHYHLGKIKELIRLNFSYKKEYQKSIEYCKHIERKKNHTFRNMEKETVK